MDMDLKRFFAKGDLIPVICQDERNGEVLMLGYANEEALRRTMESGTAWFFSRSRQKSVFFPEHTAPLCLAEVRLRS